MTSNDYSRKLSYNMDIVISVNLHYSEILLSQFIFCLFFNQFCKLFLWHMKLVRNKHFKYEICMCIALYNTKIMYCNSFIYIHNNVYHITFQLLYFVVVYSYWIHMDSCHTFQILFKLSLKIIYYIMHCHHILVGRYLCME